MSDTKQQQTEHKTNVPKRKARDHKSFFILLHYALHAPSTINIQQPTNSVERKNNHGLLSTGRTSLATVPKACDGAGLSVQSCSMPAFEWLEWLCSGEWLL
jgi:hypothetical protein